MKVRFLADNDLRKAIVRGAIRQESQLDFKSAQAAGLDGLSDQQVLALASSENRILVSHDFETMPANFLKFSEVVPSPGALLISQALPVGQAIECLLLIWEASAPEDWRNRVCLVPSLATVCLAPAEIS